MKNYEFIDHTADIAMKAYGETVSELFINSAKGLFSSIYPDKPPRTVKMNERHIHIKAEIIEDLLVSWLNELISIFYTYHFLPKSYNIEIKDNNEKTIKGIIKGNYINIDESKIATEIKSAAYNIRIERNKRGFETTIIFDV